MLLNPSECALFFRLHGALMYFVNRELGVLPEIKTPQQYARIPLEARREVHQAFLDEIDLVERFVDENPAGLADEELTIVHSWRHLVDGKFFIFRYLQKYTVFLDSRVPPVAYGVVALSDPFEDLVGSYLPVMVEVTLLPFQGRIIYDGIVAGYNVEFGSGIRASLNDSYKEAKQRLGIVTSLPIGEPSPTRQRQSRTKTSKRRDPTNAFEGRWRITSMDLWDQTFVHEAGEGHFEFEAGQRGFFQFGYVQGDIDYRLGTRDGQPAIEFSFEGMDEIEPANGRGWATLEGDELAGMIFFHGGDQSGFRAKRRKRRRR